MSTERPVRTSKQEPILDATQLDSADVAQVLEKIGRLLDFRGDNAFKVRAYRTAADAVRVLDEDLATIVAGGRLREIPGIGAALADKITTLVTTGRLEFYDRLLSEVPLGVLDVLSVPGLGPRRARAAFEALGVASLDDLERAATSGALADVPGFGPKSIETLLSNLEGVRAYAGHWLRVDALPVAERLVRALDASGHATRIEIAGGLRRRMETVREIDLVAATDDPQALLDALAGLPAVIETIGRDQALLGVRVARGIPARLRAVPPASFAFALLHATGSAAHRSRLCDRAGERALALTETGLAPCTGGRSMEALEEADIYAALELSWIPPELREDRGEIEAAAGGALARLVETSDLRGAVHCHTTWSDGRATVAEMAAATAQRGWTYLVISDHSRSAAYAGGLGIEDLERQRDEIRAADAATDGLTIFAGSEVDILPDGTLDYPHAVLDELDCVIASVHTRLSLPRSEQTVRVVRAIAHPSVDILGHPTARLLLKREGMDLDMDAVLDATAKHGVAIEVNGQPRRLDLDWRWHQAAIRRGIRLVATSDAHTTDSLDLAAYAVEIARKGGAQSKDMLNTRDVDGFRAGLRRNQ